MRGLLFHLLRFDFLIFGSDHASNRTFFHATLFLHLYIWFNRCPTFDTVIDLCSAAFFGPELAFQTVFFVLSFHSDILILHLFFTSGYCNIYPILVMSSMSGFMSTL